MSNNGNGQRPTLTLDGERVPFTRGESLYEITQRHAKEVPTLCYDERLEAFGACRLCAVEVEGIRNPVASCTTEAQPDMVVKTRTDSLEKHRKTLLEMVASENPRGDDIHPLRGLASQELAQLTVRYEVDGTRFEGKRSGHSRHDDPNPMILRDYDHCISCYRCVRVCAEQEGDYAISVQNRGFHTQITTEFDGHLKGSACTFCGQCVQTCPTGALGDQRSMAAQDDVQSLEEVESTRTICPYCGVGCSVDILSKDDRIVSVRPAMDGPANEGALCVKGQFAWDWVQSPDRLTSPMVRVDGELVECDWDTALDRAAEGLRKVRDEHGRHAIYGVASGRAPHESAYAMQKLIRAGFGTNQIDNCSRA